MTSCRVLEERPAHLHPLKRFFGKLGRLVSFCIREHVIHDEVVDVSAHQLRVQACGLNGPAVRENPMGVAPLAALVAELGE